MQSTGFRATLEELINRQSLENGSETPDFILANFLADSLEVFDRAINLRDVWYGRMGKRKETKKPTSCLESTLPGDFPQVPKRR